MILKDIPGLAKEHSDKIIGLFEALPKDSELWLFGSRAKGNFREGSDIDLALKGNEITIKNRDEILLKYETLYLPWKLDLLLYNQTEEPALVSHIDRVGILLFKQ